MTFKALPESTSYRDPVSGEFFQRRGTVSDFGRIEPYWQPSSMFNNYSSGPVRTGDLGGKYGAFFQEKSIDPLQAQSSLNNENELLAFGLPGISALLNRGLNRVKNISGEYTGQAPSPAAAAAKSTGDPLNEHLEKLLLQGQGKDKGLTAAFALGARILNPGSASAMTLDDAKRLGYYK